MSNTPKIRFKGFTDDWEQRKLGELCERITRKNKNGESDLPLTIASQYGLIDQRDFFNKVVAAKDMSNYYLLKKGEFAYNKSYSNGFDYGSIKRLNAYEQGCLSTLYICFGITSDDIESDYLECFFDTLKWYSDITMICAEGARNHGLLNVDTKAFFDEVTIEMPSSKDEQKKISTYLNNLDNLITLHQRKCDETKELKKYMLQKMFPKKGEKVPEIRFEGFTDDWEQRKCEEIFDKIGIPVDVNEKDIYREIGIRSHGKGIFHKDEVTGKELGNKRVFWVEPNCFVVNIVFAWERAVAKTTENENGMIASHRFPMYKPKIGVVDLDYITKFFTTNIGKEILEMASPGGAGRNKTLGQKEFANSKIWIPSYEEQRKIGKLIDELDNAITLHQRKCDELKEVKKYMLQNMFPQKG